MRRIIILISCILLAAACTKDPVPTPEDNSSEVGKQVIAAEEFETALMDALAELDMDKEGAFLKLFYAAASEYDSRGLFGPIADQMLHGHIVPTGRFVAANSVWTYKPDEDFVLSLPEHDGLTIEVKYEGEQPMFPGLPVSADIFLKTQPTTVISHRTVYSAAYKVDGGWECTFAFAPERPDQSFCLSLSVRTDGERSLKLDLGPRISFRTDPFTALEFFLLYEVIDRFYRNTEELIPQIDFFNERCAIPFFLDGCQLGFLGLEAFEEESELFADFVLWYPAEGTSYCVQLNFFK